MIQTIQIKQFKCFEAFTLDLGNITLLTGYNGAGKSSSIQPLLLLAQVLREPPPRDVLQLNGSLVRLGSAGDVVAAGNGEPVSFIFSDNEGNRAAWTFEVDRQLGRNELRLKSSSFSFSPTDTKEWFPAGRSHHLLERIRETVFIGAGRASFGEAQPYPDTGIAVNADVGPDGRFAGFWFVQQADEPVDEARRLPSDGRVNVRSQAEAWLRELFPGASVNSEQIEGLALAKTSFALGDSTAWRRPSNVGYGLSYAFPIIVALLCAKVGQIVVIDSPEAHLHPRAQSNMGRILARFAAAGVQIVVESHSDHLLSGLRLAIKDRSIRSEQVAIHFFGANEGADNGRIRISVAEDGGVSNWPEGFFDQSINDLMELS